ncbi:MAG: methyltransferase domain-containing protein, partial [Planctomycetaceae bacterium]|nr:methyltransferase domain-containing protein [Planctomycetaceae bacterium]
MNYRHRRCEAELMDRPELDSGLHHRALNGLSRVNWWSGTTGRIWKALKELARQRGLSQLHVLDLASGGGDVAISLARQGNEALPVIVQGWDKSDTATAYATERAARLRLTNVSFLQRDALTDPIPQQFDAVVCTLFLHHLSNADAVLLLRRMRDAARHAVLVDDLRRTRVGYGLAWIGTRLLCRSPIVHFDGPVSVRAAFEVDEIRNLAK